MFAAARHQQDGAAIVIVPALLWVWIGAEAEPCIFLLKALKMNWN